MRLLKQSTAANVMVFMTDSADHVTGKTGLTLAITASKDGAAFGSISPTVTERGSGWYSVALTSSHTDTLGDLALHVTSSGADATDLACRIVAGALDADVSTRLATAGYTSPPSVGAIRAEMDAASTKLANLDALISTRAAAGDSMGLTAGAVDAVWDEVLDLVYTARQLMRLVASMAGGKASGLDTLAPAYRDLADTKNRIAATTDASGNRTAVTLDLT